MAFKTIDWVKFVLLLLVCAALPLMLLVVLGQMLVSTGLAGAVYFVVLLILALCASVVLFRLLKSDAAYRGEPLYGRLKLSGPVVCFFLILLIGITYTKPSPQPFDVTIFFHGKGGISDQVVTNGIAKMTLGNDIREEPVARDGTATFRQVAAKYRQAKVEIWLDNQDWEASTSSVRYQLESEAIRIPVQRKTIKLSGRVVGAKTDGQSVVGAKVSAVGKMVYSNALGSFSLSFTDLDTPEEINVTVTADGYKPWRGSIPTGSTGATITLHPEETQ